jgi:hypothetical protein
VLYWSALTKLTRSAPSCTPAQRHITSAHGARTPQVASSTKKPGRSSPAWPRHWRRQRSSR